MIKRDEIRIRDPFILVDEEKKLYYMYGTTALLEGLSAKNSFSAYVSKDLENFEGPYVIFDGAEINFWATRDYWAPEVHKYNGKYFLFGSMTAENRRRSTQIFVSDTPIGKFTPLTDDPITPKDWECLDGTLWVQDGVPYIVFCHEWLQVENGEIWAMPLSRDLTAAIDKPILLFKAGDNPFVESFKAPQGDSCRITDAPFLFKECDQLKMIWSSMSDGKYAVLVAKSSGGILGKWTHGKSGFKFDGGHAMIFNDLEGNRRISLHAPNTPPNERAVFFFLGDDDLKI